MRSGSDRSLDLRQCGCCRFSGIGAVSGSARGAGGAAELLAIDDRPEFCARVGTSTAWSTCSPAIIRTRQVITREPISDSVAFGIEGSGRSMMPESRKRIRVPCATSGAAARGSGSRVLERVVAAVGDGLMVLAAREQATRIAGLHLLDGLSLGRAPVDLDQPRLCAAEGDAVVLADDAPGLLGALQRRVMTTIPVHGRLTGRRRRGPARSVLVQAVRGPLEEVLQVEVPSVRGGRARTGSWGALLDLEPVCGRRPRLSRGAPRDVHGRPDARPGPAGRRSGDYVGQEGRRAPPRTVMPGPGAVRAVFVGELPVEAG